MIEAAYWLYFQCVDFTIHLANLTSTTYRDTNSFLFFLLWPTVTVLLGLWVSWNAAVIRVCASAPGRRAPEAE